MIVEVTETVSVFKPFPLLNYGASKKWSNWPNFRITTFCLVYLLSKDKHFEAPAAQCFEGGQQEGRLLLAAC